MDYILHRLNTVYKQNFENCKFFIIAWSIGVSLHCMEYGTETLHGREGSK